MKVGKFVAKICATAIGGTIAYVAGSFIRDLFDVDENAIELEDALEDDDDFFIDEDELFGDDISEEKPEPEKVESEEKEKTE